MGLQATLSDRAVGEEDAWTGISWATGRAVMGAWRALGRGGRWSGLSRKHGI